MPVVNPYLNFPGTCEAAFNFYKSVFGGEFAYVGRFGDMPPQEGYTIPESEKNNIMHISLPLSNGSVLMGSDVGGEWSKEAIVGNNISLSINASSKDEADRVFNGLAEGGVVSMPMNKTFWGDYFGMLKDKFNINWMMSFNENAQKKS